jgi:8-oxo-dGTP pyrophosphatase MutT (NUDIX family)
MPLPDYLRRLRAKIGHEAVVMGGMICVVINEAGEVLAQRRSDDGKWCLPGGILDPDEHPGPGAAREVREETGVDVQIERILAIYSDPEDCLVIYPNDDQVMFLQFVMACRPVGGKVQVNDDESLDVAYFSRQDLPPMDRGQARYVKLALQDDPRTDFRIVPGKGNQLMGMSDYVRNLREKIGHDLLFTPAASAVVFNDQGQVLLQQRSDNGNWALPGGAIDPGEEPANAAIREVFEETGVSVLPERIICVESGPDYFVRYPNEDEALILAIVFVCKLVSGEPRVNDDESLDVRYFPVSDLPESLSERHRNRITLALRNDPRTMFTMQSTQQEKKSS